MAEGGIGYTPGKLFIIAAYYVPYWMAVGVALFLRFCVMLVKTYSYPATANGPHQVEVCIRRLTWYPATMAISITLPTLHAMWFHQHQEASIADEMWYAAMFSLLSLFAFSGFCSLGVLLVEFYVGKRDRNVVRGDPLVPDPVPRDNLNLEDMPANLRPHTLRERFWLLMNTMEERKDTAIGEHCPRCNSHGFRPALKAAQQAEAARRAQFAAEAEEKARQTKAQAAEEHNVLVSSAAGDAQGEQTQKPRDAAAVPAVVGEVSMGEADHQ